MLACIDRGTGRTVLLLHGQPGDGASWAPVIDRLADRFRVMAPDRPGYGATDCGPVGMVENADILAGFLRSRNAGPATVVGHSWSGGVAVLMAARHPDVVRSLVLAGAVGSPDSVNGLDRLLAVPGLGDVLTVAALVAIETVLPWLRSAAVMPGEGLGSGEGPGPGPGPAEVGARAGAPVHSSAAARVRRYLAATMPDERFHVGWSDAWGRGRRTFMVEQRALLAELPSVTACLGSLDVPVSVVVGEWDVVVPPASARSLAAAIPGAELVPIPGVGHFLARDATDRLTKVIESSDARAGGAANPGG
ncbi:MAG: alpha/beta fold hydrolase [Acidimicrobiales bacterium]